MSKAKFRILKSTGEEAFFSSGKLMNSLQRAGADNETSARILQQVKDSLREGMTTKEIYRLAFSLLRSGARHVAARYNLKRAIVQLGPEGFYFEKYIGAILAAQGHYVQIGLTMNGMCVTHEVDVLAQKDHVTNIIECKFHKHDGLNCDVKIPLYIHSRFNDIKNYQLANGDKNVKAYYGWVVTNTRFTQDAIDYGVCSGLKLLSWNYPSVGGLRDLIDELKLYPITCLTSLTNNEKILLLQKGFLLASDLLNDMKSLKRTGISPQKISIILNEIRQLCDGHEKVAAG